MAAVPSSTSASPPPDVGADVAAWRRAVAALPVEFRIALAPAFEIAGLHAERMKERDALLIQMTATMPTSARAAANLLELELSRYAASAWRFDHQRDFPHDRRNTLAHRVLKLNNGQVPSARSLRRLFAK